MNCVYVFVKSIDTFVWWLEAVYVCWLVQAALKECVGQSGNIKSSDLSMKYHRGTDSEAF